MVKIICDFIYVISGLKICKVIPKRQKKDEER